MIKKNYIEIVFLISLGVASSLSLPPYNYLIINFFTFSSFFIFLFKKSKTTKSKKDFFFYGWLFGFGYFLSSLYWISISLTFDQNFKFLIPITIILIPSFLGIFYGLVTFCFIISKPQKIVSSFFIFSLLFGVFEFIRGSILTGFPWNLIAYSFVNHLEILSITSIIGTYGFNLFCISLFTSPAIFILRETKKDIGVCVIFLFLPFLFYLYGSSYKETFNSSDNVSYDYKVRAIGSNISLDRYYSNIDPVSVINDLINISEPERDEKTIFVWPEGILPDISQKELVDRARDAGVMAYVVKPFTIGDLIPAIEIAISRHTQMRSLAAEVADLHDRLETRKIIDRAKGILMKALNLSEPEAFSWIQRAAMDRRLTMKQVAEAVISPQAVPES